ncbi:MAG: HEAT repeat domain-containing protein, partial [Candidatus Omnitrophota bacterium]
NQSRSKPEIEKEKEDGKSGPVSSFIERPRSSLVFPSIVIALIALLTPSSALAGEVVQAVSSIPPVVITGFFVFLAAFLALVAGIVIYLIIKGKELDEYPPEMLEALAELKSDDRQTRINAFSKLASIGDKRATKHLIGLLYNKDRETQVYAMEALGALKDKRAIKPLIKKLKKQPLDFGNHAVEIAIMRSLGQLGASEAVELLLGFTADFYPGEIRVAAIEALGNIRDRRAAKPLLNIFHRNSDEALVMSTPLFEVSAVALGKIGDTEALPYLLTYADSTSRPLETLERRDAAKAGLQEMLSSKDTDVLKRLLHHSDYSIKAEEALAKIIQETTDTEELIKLISSEEIIAHTYTKEDLGPRTKLRFMLLDKLKGVNDERLARPFLKIFSPEELYQRLSSNGKYLIIVRDVLFNMIQTTNDTDFLLECLKRALVDGSAEKMGNAAAERLGQIKDPETVIPLTRHLFMTFPYAPHPSLEKHRCATSIVNALGELCDPRSTNALSRVLSSTHSRPGNLSAKFEAHAFDHETRKAAEGVLATIKAVKIDSKPRLPKIEVKSERSSRLGAALKKVGRWLWENRKRIFICLLIVALLVAANYMLPDIPGKRSLGGIPFFPIAGSVAVANPEEKVIAEQMVTLHRRMAK